MYDFHARYYNPVLGRWFNIDPALAHANPYLYANNNPMMFVDPSGEVPWLVFAAVALLGGGANVYNNWDNIDGFWQGLSSFVAGAGLGVGIVASGGSLGAVLAVGAGGGAVVGAHNDIVAQTGKNFDGIEDVDWGEVGKSAVVSSIATTAAVGAGYLTAGATGLTANGVNSPLARGVVTGAVAGGAGHIVGGTAYSLIDGQPLGKAFTNSFEGVGRSMIWGGIMGGVSATATSLAQRVNPWNGKTMGLGVPKGTPENIHMDKQGKHMVGHKNYDTEGGRSILQANPQELLDGVRSGKYNVIRTNQNTMTVDFGKPIGVHYNNGVMNGITHYGTVHYGPTGAHIVPANPVQY